MKIFSYLMALIFSINFSFANTVTTRTAMLNYEFSKLRYELDSQPYTQFENIQIKVEASLSEIRAMGYSPLEIKKSILNQLKDGNLKSDFKKLIAVIKKQNLSEKNLWIFLGNYFHSIDSSGAAFISEPRSVNPWLIVAVGMTFLLLAFVDI